VKSIYLKRVEIETSNGMIVLDYKTQFVNLLEFVPEGVSINELSTLVSVAQKLRRASDSVELDTQEWTTLKSRLEATKFTMVTQEVVDMIRAVTEAEEV